MTITKSKPGLIILSDIWGREKSCWIDYYTAILKKNFEITYYDCCELGKIDKTDYSEENLHRQFLDGGIDRAVSNLMLSEKSNITVLAFSIGGTIAWKASLEGLRTDRIFAVSSTRLRKETERPDCVVESFYGENDVYKPDNDWSLKLNIQSRIIKDEDHYLYQRKEFAEMLSKRINHLAQYFQCKQ